MTAVARRWHQVRAALAAEKARTLSLVRTEETAFLPSALEIVERPISPTARSAAWLLLAGVLLVITWMTFGKIDIVASAGGRIVPGDDVKLIQSAEPGTVRAILVSDNQIVKAGQPLIELNPTVVGAEAEQAREALRTAQLDAARDAAVLAALDGHPLVLAAPAGTPPDVIAAQTALARDTLAGIREADGARAADRRSAIAAHAEAAQQVAKIDQTLPLLDTEIGVYEELLTKGFVAKMKVLEMRRQRLATAKDRDIALATVRKTQADADAAGHASGQSQADARSKLRADLVRALSESQLRVEELTKAGERSRLQRLLSPVDGAVTQLAVHTIGGVVEVAKPLMVIVPTNSKLRADVQVLNKDVGFVRAGQPVVLKLAAFPFTRYGTVAGHVESVASNAVVDQKLGLVFPARIALDKPRLDRSGADLSLIAGMEVTADIRTGHRTLMSYLLSPIESTVRQAGRER
jgi:hemolysin D